MSGRLESRLAKIEQRRREQGEANDPNRPPDLAELFGYPRGTPFAKILQDDADRIAREVADGTYVPIPPPDPDYMHENVIDVESYLLKLDGNREGWKQRQRELKRDLHEMIRRDWPDIDAEPSPAKDCP